MKLLNKPVWAEGMYLGPHNFQAQSRYFEDSLNFVTMSLWRDAYGFAGVQFDADALRNGTLAMTSGRGLFEDGLAFDLPGSDAAPPPREFGALFSPVADHLTMHLAVPVSLQEGRNTSLDNHAPDASVRYQSVEQLLPDENTGRDEKKIRVGRKNLQLLAESELTDQFVSLPVLRIVRTGSGRFESDSSFVPPCITLSASGSLAAMLSRLIDILDDKSAAFAREQQQRHGKFEAGLSARHVAQYWFLHTLNSSVSMLRHFLLSKHVHPQELFREMSRLGGLFAPSASKCIHGRCRRMTTVISEHVSPLWTSISGATWRSSCPPRRSRFPCIWWRIPSTTATSSMNAASGLRNGFWKSAHLSGKLT